MNKPKQKAPSIPGKKISHNSYSGRGFDTVGPAVYNPNHNIMRHHAPIGDFQTSKEQRKLFEPSINIENTTLPDKMNPGPGQYEAINENAKRQFNAQGNTCNFLSKVPNCKDTKDKVEGPGPGAYQKLFNKTGGFGGDASTAEDSNFGERSMTAGNQTQFNSTTHRVDFWRNDMSAPYTKQTYLKDPGPGAYFPHKKKGDDIKSRLLVEETVHVPFGSMDPRDCNKLKGSKVPGPGTYIDINNPNNSSICKSLNKIKEDRTLAESQGVKLGVFGSTTSKWTGSWLKPKEGPDPGQYRNLSSYSTKPSFDLAVKGRSASSSTGRIMTTTLTGERNKPDCVFESKIDRFGVFYSNKAPGIRILKSQGGARKKIVGQSLEGKHVYDKDAVFGIENQITCLKDNGYQTFKNQQQRAMDFEQVAGKRVGFDATSPRFNYN